MSGKENAGVVDQQQPERIQGASEIEEAIMKALDSTIDASKGESSDNLQTKAPGKG